MVGRVQRRRLTAIGIQSDLPELHRLIKTNTGSYGAFIRSSMEAFVSNVVIVITWYICGFLQILFD